MSNYRKQSNKPQKKRSGAKIHSKKGEYFFITGWNASKSRGMIKVKCTDYSKTKQTETNGVVYENWFVTITFMKTGNIVKTNGIYNQSKKLVTIPEWNLVVSPTSPNGGYCGKIK